MKLIPIQMMLFVSYSLLQDYWIYYKLPQIQYWEVKNNHLK
ncbi:hypothetical protein [Evansella cellulosilytica]|uniref:Uncharacterized protein n=1 Tax=Evansella cellulosilytica (strain ATCC 21833 / DSM 2522 / FERM P-1141 / JCM 9156 / N-4) TaxID=649639 RepID=E6U0V9_EVAC2|nr:hypothetical protein [Evansella cellulosilytica]ADU30271.1 hypothetical protein Bcell_2009 [Evansella cellulosilytica DSM 2522]